MKKVQIGLMIVCILVFLCSGAILVRYYYNAKKANDNIEKLVDIKNSEVSASNEKNKDAQILEGYQKLYKKNHDFKGWLQIVNTKINYPVMQTKKNNQFYLHKDFEKKYSVDGLPFLDSKCDVDNNKNNLIIYGHHMRSGNIFATLLNYEKKKFYNLHKEICFDTLKERRRYKVIATFYSKVYKKETNIFKYYDYIGKLSKKEFATYIKEIKKLSCYKINETAVYGEGLLTLSTCSYQTKDGRFVVVAKRI